MLNCHYLLYLFLFTMEYIYKLKCFFEIHLANVSRETLNFIFTNLLKSRKCIQCKRN